MANALTFGEWLKRRRGGLGLTQKQLAQQMGYAEITLRRVEANELRPSRELAQRLAEVLQIAPEDHEWFVRAARQEIPYEDSALLALPPAVVGPPPAPAANLPYTPTPLVGREQEIGEVLRLLGLPATRLVTLTGAGGTGKTRVAVAVAHAAAGSRPGFAHGVHFVHLASVVDAALVLPAIAQVLGVQVQGERPLLNLIQDRLRDKVLLLLLDNFEHLVDAAPLLTDLLAAAPGLKILATSRRPLHIQGEIEAPVPPLAAAAGPAAPDGMPDTIGEAAQLFVLRARQVRPDFQLTAGNVGAVLEICRRLDGLPLAIELAAVRTKVLPPPVLLQQMARRLPLLTASTRDTPTRQQTMRNTIAWSYGLLAEEEQVLFRRLGVFAGGCTMAAAARVAGLRGTHVRADLDGLTALVDHNLLQVDWAGGEPRFHMLQTLQEYAQEQLEAAGEEEQVRGAFVHYYLDLTQSLDPLRRGADLAAEHLRLEAEHDNLRAVLSWCMAGHAPGMGAQLAARLSVLWEYFGDLEEGRQWLDLALAAPAHELAAEVRGEVLLSAGALAYRQGDFAAAQRLLQTSLTVWQAREERGAIACAWLYLGMVTMERGDFPAAQEHMHISLSLYHTLDDAIGVAFAIGNLGNVALLAGDAANARLCLEQAQAIFAPTESLYYACLVRLSMGWLHLLQGDWARARRALGATLQQLGSIGEKRYVLYCVLGLVGTAAGVQDYERAACLLGIAEAMRSATHTHILPLLGMAVRDFGLQIQAALPPAAYTAAVRRGEAMAPDQVIAFVCAPDSTGQHAQSGAA